MILGVGIDLVDLEESNFLLSCTTGSHAALRRVLGRKRRGD